MSNKKLFAVTYRDNKNVKHMVFMKGFKSYRNLENQYGKVTIKPFLSNISFVAK